ncbi:MAG: RluA family pseudouridine synthase [Ruminococcus flavefaciens]|nr:RluA family pseudouridine synthase [Ruminococcus flavefaciens]
MRELKLKVCTKESTTLQSFLLGQSGVSKRLLTRLKRQTNGITRDGIQIRSIDTVYPGDEIILRFEDQSFLEPNPELKIPVVFENERLVVFNKPAGVPVHPSIKHQGDTLGNCFAALYPELTFRPINRLDKDTSGLCIIAKDAHASSLLQGSCRKIYYAAAEGDVPDSGRINAPIARERESIILRCVRPDGQPSVTLYKVLKRANGHSLAEVIPQTGRTHQIRVHFAYTGHPLAGDDMYGGSLQYIKRQALHCGSITFKEPTSGSEITVTADIPEDMAAIFADTI